MASRLSGLGEFAWLKKLLPRLYWPSSLHPQLCIGPGDDAGVLRISPGRVLVATTDAMVEGIHFEPKWFSWTDLGEKILAVNMSDLAAMGKVKPLAALVTAAFPGDTPVKSVEKFYKGLESCARRWKTGFLGGDTVGSKEGWFVSLTLVGEADPRHLIRRTGARVGDYLVTTGALGLAAAGLEVLQKGKTGWSWTRPLIQAFRRPQPRLEAGGILGERHWASSLIDSSDGLGASVRLLTEASKVGSEIDLPSLPVHQALRRWALYMGRNPWEYMVHGGEDYELIFTVSPRNWPKIKQKIMGVTVIGRILPARRGCSFVAPGQHFPLRGYGYNHFKRK